LKGDIERALVDYTEVLRIDDHPMYRKQRGWANFLAGKYVAAASDFARALQDEPKDGYAVLWLYLARERAGDPDALGQLKANSTALKETDPSYPLISYFADPKAVKSFGASTNCETHFYYGQLNILVGDSGFAKKVLKMADDICPKNQFKSAPEGWLKVLAEAEMKRVDQVLQTRSEQMQRREQQERQHVAAVGQLIEKYTLIIERGDGESIDNRVIAYNNRAALYQSNNDFDHAIANYTEAIRLDSGRAQSFSNRCSAYTVEGDLERAIADCSEAIRLDTNFSAGLKQRGLANFIGAHYEAAASDFQRAQQIEPDDVYSVLWLYLAREHYGDPSAFPELREIGDSLKSAEWPSAMVKLFSWDARELLRETDSADPGQAQFYIGEWHLLRGARPDAIVALNRAAAGTCPKGTLENLGARAELKRLDEILRERADKKERKAAEDRRQMQEQRTRETNFETLVQSKRDGLALAGLNVFEYHFKNTAWGYINRSCLIGATGDVYIYDARESPEGRLLSHANEQDYQRAVELAKSLGDREIETRRVAFDAGTGLWTATNAGVKRVLKVTGEGEGQLSYPNASELVKLISGWCPAAAAALKREQRSHTVCVQPDPRIPIQMCQ
jgi:lipoprotein NlpI